MKNSRLDHLNQFYSLMDTLDERLEGPRFLSDCTAKSGWPSRGVYFFMESGEDRAGEDQEPRIVRVGTHAVGKGSRAKLWDRLSRHRGPEKTGIGRQRSSIFRFLVGTALIERDRRVLPSWYDGGATVPKEVLDNERFMEMAVSDVIRGMPLLWLEVEDAAGRESLRGYIERNSIALLSNYGKEPIDPPSKSWLGHHCTKERVRLSGLWNQRHVEDEYEPEFLDALARLIGEMEVPW
ncbi:MAG: hypothetical protein OXH83_02390 [Bryobacterales bacterium]|nr:hypothetical protein [Bryobacterales bacterium]